LVHGAMVGGRCGGERHGERGGTRICLGGTPGKGGGARAPGSGGGGAHFRGRFLGGGTLVGRTRNRCPPSFCSTGRGRFWLFLFPGDFSRGQGAPAFFQQAGARKKGGGGMGRGKGAQVWTVLLRGWWGGDRGAESGGIGSRGFGSGKPTPETQAEAGPGISAVTPRAGDFFGRLAIRVPGPGNHGRSGEPGGGRWGGVQGGGEPG